MTNCTASPALREAPATQQASIGPALPRQIECLLFDIATAALHADSLGYYCDDASESPEHAEAVMTAMRETLRRMGWMADLALHRIGGMCARGPDATEWLLTPETRRAGGH